MFLRKTVNLRSSHNIRYIGRTGAAAGIGTSGEREEYRDVAMTQYRNYSLENWKWWFRARKTEEKRLWKQNLGKLISPPFPSHKRQKMAITCCYTTDHLRHTPVGNTIYSALIRCGKILVGQNYFDLCLSFVLETHNKIWFFFTNFLVKTMCMAEYSGMLLDSPISYLMQIVCHQFSPLL